MCGGVVGRLAYCVCSLGVECVVYYLVATLPRCPAGVVVVVVVVVVLTVVEMARTACVIEFDNNLQKVFYGGQLLSGRVTLTLHKEKTVRGSSNGRILFLLFLGVSG